MRLLTTVPQEPSEQEKCDDQQLDRQPELKTHHTSTIAATPARTADFALASATDHSDYDPKTAERKERTDEAVSTTGARWAGRGSAPARSRVPLMCWSVGIAAPRAARRRDVERRAMGVFLMVTAVIVLFPVFLQLRAKEYAWRAVWGYLLFAAGLFSVGASYSFFDGSARRNLSIAGFAAILIGLLVQERPSAGRSTERKY